MHSAHTGRKKGRTWLIIYTTRAQVYIAKSINCIVKLMLCFCRATTRYESKYGRRDRTGTVLKPTRDPDRTARESNVWSVGHRGIPASHCANSDLDTSRPGDGLTGLQQMCTADKVDHRNARRREPWREHCNGSRSCWFQVQLVVTV